MAQAILGGMYYEIEDKEIVTERETDKAIAVYPEYKGRKTFFFVPKSQMIKLDNGKWAVQAWVFDRNYSRSKKS